jgi:hypothetical protein
MALQLQRDTPISTQPASVAALALQNRTVTGGCVDQDQRTKEWNQLQRALDAANATIQQLEVKAEEEAIAREFEAWEPEPGTTIH